ncbi:hypothetical protein FSP39_004087 [Pinctada imbricata]|uniref:Cytochrome b561 domain-containing protein n=1 Tax=Pinctada imbricata TaxID=66713 RepID=A0AA89C9V3_PINIB|nr:hypothetical protein FSP39_004087 [Pinctada imbricata]
MEALDKQDPQPQQGSLAFFTFLVLVIQCVGLTAVILVAVWMGHYRGGFDWGPDNPSKEFNYHPVFMVIGMIFLYSDAILAYRVFRNVKKTYSKVVHGAIHIGALLFSAVGLKAVFDSHNYAKPPIPNLYSLHSWLGLAAVILYGIQWLSGFVAFAFPSLSLGAKKLYMPHHVFWGVAILCLATGAALMGITEKALFTNCFTKNFHYSALPSEGLVINFLGVAIVVLVALVIYVVTRPEYKRQPSPDEEHIQLVG